MKNCNDLEKIKIILHQRINNYLLDQKERLEDYGDFINYVIEGYLWGSKTDKIEIKYPINWWNAFKEVFYLKFMLKFYPVKYRIHNLSFNVLYPNFKFNSPDHIIVNKRFEKVE